MQKSKTRYIVLAAAILLLLPFVSSFLGLTVDWLFFVETGFTAERMVRATERLYDSLCDAKRVSEQ